jgi:hypothetical protein
MSLLWKLGGVAIALVAAYFLVTMYGKARYQAGQSDERTIWQAKVAEAERGKLAAFKDGLARVQAGETVYHETIRQLPPVTNTIVERSTRYAATPAGAAQCLAPDRVLWLDETRSALFPAAYPPPADGGARALPADSEGEEP